MSVTVVPNTTSTPPRFDITITTPDGSAMSAVELTRGDGGWTPTRDQPAPGFASRSIQDYEAPWDLDLSYAARMTYGSTTDTEYSTPTRLSPSVAWAIHPTTPGLSVCIDRGLADNSAMGIANLGEVTRASTSVTHPILGAARPVVTRIGPRSSSVVTLTLGSVTTDDEDALWGLLDDQTPLLIRIPSSWGWNWEDGYYSVGDVTAGRVMQYGPEQRRTFTLPLTRVDSPAGAQAAEWDYPSLLAAFADYPSIAAAYADYPSLQSNTRR